MAMWAAGPPKAVNPSRRKYRAISRSDPAEARKLWGGVDGSPVQLIRPRILNDSCDFCPAEWGGSNYSESCFRVDDSVI